MSHEHQLTEIIRFAESMHEDSVVRWCAECGAVVVDIDCDNRISPGAIMPLQFPKTAAGNGAKHV